jgi:hypothetical protein
MALADPFDALFRFQRVLDLQLDSDWLENTISGIGAFTPINVFQRGSDFVAIIEMPGVSKDDLGLEVRGIPSVSPARRQPNMAARPACIAESASLAGSIGQLASRCSSTRIGLWPSTKTAFWRSRCRARRATSETDQGQLTSCYRIGDGSHGTGSTTKA